MRTNTAVFYPTRGWSAALSAVNLSTVPWLSLPAVPSPLAAGGASQRTSERSQSDLHDAEPHTMCQCQHLWDIQTATAV